eukprot:2799336-Pleurochrysis_carterae.AAC.2
MMPSGMWQGARRRADESLEAAMKRTLELQVWRGMREPDRAPHLAPSGFTSNARLTQQCCLRRNAHETRG